ncbi:hypothetical protein BOVATA_005580 [Babesia ovata]|uniref:Uncharacterized protein n=1 Tax=Babesia ovata TaxID=189622 RepID=A0A2H6K7U8_9APIC|nr:uncharacterized protein BOVATA_005580 [Babesia ovata]GBE59065.1 hypothetical protein BOVATA_005580 [Babesia ovata]
MRHGNKSIRLLDGYIHMTSFFIKVCLWLTCFVLVPYTSISSLNLVQAVQLLPSQRAIYRNGFPQHHRAFLFGVPPRVDNLSLVTTRKGALSQGLRHTATYRKISGPCINVHRPTALGLFGGLSGWFSNAIGSRWYVPPMPTGKLASTILRKHGPLQTEEETKSFFELIGAHRDADLVEIGQAYEHAVDTLPEDMREVLKRSFHEFLRKQFVEAFEHMESFIKRGPVAWEEYWDPSKDAYGNPVVSKFATPEEEDQAMADLMPPELDVSKFREYWRKNSSRFNTMMNKVDMTSRVRLTSNFGGRLLKCTTTMIPVMIMGLFPQFSSMSVALQGLLASGFIFKGDRAAILAREKKSLEPGPAAAPPARSPSSRTLLTSAVLCVHSLLGIGAAKLMEHYTAVLEYLTPQILKVASINFQFLIAALLWDTSDLTPSGHAKLEERRMSKITDTLTDIVD